MDSTRQKRKEEISKALTFIQWVIFLFEGTLIESETFPASQWLISFITKLCHYFPKHVYFFCSRSSLAYPEPEGYQVPALITNPVLCLSLLSFPPLQSWFHFMICSQLVISCCWTHQPPRPGTSFILRTFFAPSLYGGSVDFYCHNDSFRFFSSLSQHNTHLSCCCHCNHSSCPHGPWRISSQSNLV